MSTYSANGRIDPDRGIIGVFIGKKRSGKSILAMWYAMQYPGDIVVLDIAGDDGPSGPGVVEYHYVSVADGTMPDRFPVHRRQYTDDGKPVRMIVRFVPNPRSPTFIADCDAVVGIAMRHGKCLLFVHETGRVAPAHGTGPEMLAFLNHNRHMGATSGLLCNPRSMNVNPLSIQQGDLVFTFELMSVRDRQRIAENIGWNVHEFHQAVLDLGPHEYLRFDANEMKPPEGQEDNRLLHFPALPPSEVQRVMEWRDDPYGIGRKRAKENS